MLPIKDKRKKSMSKIVMIKMDDSSCKAHLFYVVESERCGDVLYIGRHRERNVRHPLLRIDVDG